jgi:hypothetical protein
LSTLQREQVQHVSSFLPRQEGEEKEKGQDAPPFISEFLTPICIKII